MRSCAHADNSSNPSRAVMQVATMNNVLTSSEIGAVASGSSMIRPSVSSFCYFCCRVLHTTAAHEGEETLFPTFVPGFVKHTALRGKASKKIRMRGRNCLDLGLAYAETTMPARLHHSASATRPRLHRGQARRAHRHKCKRNRSASGDRRLVSSRA